LLWALIHGGFVLAASAASVVSWRANEQLLQARQEARTDELTGLLNRRGLYIEIERMLDTARTEARPTALLLLDLDRFKEVNDTLGHHAGDDLLRQVAGRLRACLPEAGMIGRLGGDEFVVMLASADGPAGIALAAALADALDPPFELEGLLAPVQASVGVASAPADAVTRAELLRHADVAMYRAKTNGTGVALYAAEQDRHCRSRLQLAGELKAAIGTGQFILHYQPKGDLQTGEIIGVEALVRWQHPRRGLLYPDTFLSVAEEHGLMRSFTLDVIDSALAAQHSWRQRGLETPVAVNLAAANVLDPRFPQDVAESLQRWQLPPDALQLEITEDTIMTDLPRALDVLARLGEQGIHLALDDYGTGSSSLSYLKRLPIAELKIDRSFVINMTSDHSDAIIVRSTVELARNLGLHVVAEGVETAEHWEQLRACGCHTAQGYHLARPMAGDHYTAWMRERHTPSTTTSTTRPNTAS
jgi:diguanylate cyclase (GGDEF)-like protein